MSKSNKRQLLEAQIEALTGDIKTAEEPEELTYLRRRKTFKAMLEGEMDAHLRYAWHAKEGRNSGNSRNGYSSKTLKGERLRSMYSVTATANSIRSSFPKPRLACPC